MINKKISFSDFEKTLSNIEKIILPKFQYNGEFLIKKGLVEGKKIGTTLNKLEDEWIKNNFSLEEKKIMDIIKKARD